jgi:dCMP deaminase
LYGGRAVNAGKRSIVAEQELRRPTWDEYFMGIARLTAQRSTCLRRNVGAVIVLDRHLIASGYNGAPRGLAHCSEMGGCYREKLGIPPGERHELCRGLHAEQNAIIQAAALGHAIDGATIYITHQPCAICAKMIVNAGIGKIIVGEGYPDELAVDILKEAGLKVVSLEGKDFE